MHQDVWRARFECLIEGQEGYFYLTFQTIGDTTPQRAWELAVEMKRRQFPIAGPGTVVFIPAKRRHITKTHHISRDRERRLPECHIVSKDNKNEPLFCTVAYVPVS